MFRPRFFPLALFVSLLFNVCAVAQNDASYTPDAPAPQIDSRADVPGVSVPRLVKFSGMLRDGEGHAVNGARYVSFSLYAEQANTVPLWTETQKIVADENGRYTVTLGVTLKGGIPINMFASGEARWLETATVSDAGKDPAAPRLMLVSVPFALKAEDADKLGGRAAADFALSSELEKQVAAAVADQMAKTQSKAGQGDQAYYAPDKPIGTTVQDIAPNGAARFQDNSLVEVVLVQQNGSGFGLNAIAINGSAIHASSLGVGAGNATILAQATSSTGSPVAVQGESFGATGIGVQGIATGASAANVGVRGESNGPSGRGVAGMATNSTGFTFGMLGTVTSPNGVGVRGEANGTSGGTGVVGIATSTSGTETGVQGEVSSSSGVAGLFRSNSSGGKVLLGQGPGNTDVFTVDANGNVTANGTLTATGGLTTTGVLSVGSVNVPSGNSASGLVKATNSGAGAAVEGTSTAANTGVYGKAIGGGGVGVRGEASSATGIAGVFNNTAGGQILSGQNNGTEVFNVSGSSTAIVSALQTAVGVLNPAPATPVPSAIFGHSSTAIDSAVGVSGQSDSPNGAGVYGYNTSTAAGQDAQGVIGISVAPNGIGVGGINDTTGATAAGIGVSGQSKGDTGIGVYGNASSATTLLSNPSLFTVGVWGDTSSESGQGVRGVASSTAPGASAIGVSGLSFSDSGFGVNGRATSATGFTIGVRGRADSVNGVGVLGTTSATTGPTRGVKGVTNSADNSNAVGVEGLATASTGITIGVNGVINSPDGAAVRGQASATSGTARAMEALNNSTQGTALNAFELATSGNTIGIRADVNSPTGVALQLNATAGGGQLIRAFGDGNAQRFAVSSAGDVSASGTVSAASFVGNGSGLTGLSGASTSSSNTFSSSQTFNSDVVLGTSAAQLLNNTSGGHFLRSTTGEINQWIFEEGQPKWGLFYCNDNSLCTGNGMSGGDFLITKNADQPNNVGFSLNGLPGITANTNASIRLSAVDGGAFFAGKVGIGTTTPATPLHVSTGAPTVARFETTNSAGVGMEWQSVSAGASVNWFLQATGPTAGQGNNKLVLGSSAIINPGVLTLDGTSGNVGIGTNTPATKLDVAGTVTATSFSGSGAGLTGIVAGDTSSLGGVLAANYARRDQVNNFTNTQTVTGSIGINTVSPEDTLDVTNAAGDKILIGGSGPTIRNKCVGGGCGGVNFNGGGFVLQGGYDPGAGGTIVLEGSTRADAQNNAILFLQNNVEVGRFNNGGNFGIGNTAPAEKLDVTGNIKASGTVTATGGFSGTFTGTATNSASLGGVAAANYARLDVANSFNGNQTITGGSLGIGTSSPLDRLDVASAGGDHILIGTDILRFSCGSACVLGPNAGGLIFQGGADPGAGGMIFAGGSTRGDGLVNGIQFLQNNVEVGRFNNGGNFGIGNTAPAEKLDVTGNIKASGTITAASFSGDGSALTNVSATGGTSSNTANTLVRRDGFGNFSAGNITATFSGAITGSGAGLTNIPNSATTATSVNTANMIVARDGFGNFSAGTISAGSVGVTGQFTGSGAGLTSIPNSATTATSLNTANMIVARDGFGNFAAGTITATSFSGDGSALTGIVASNASSLGGVAAANYARLDIGNAFTNTNTFSGTVGVGGTPDSRTLVDIKGTQTQFVNNENLLAVDGTLISNPGNSYSTGLVVAPTTTMTGYTNYNKGIDVSLAATGAAIAHSVVAVYVNQPSAVNGSDCVVSFGINVPNQSAPCATPQATRNYGFFENGVAGTMNYFASNVGIGNPTPAEKLDVTGNGKFSGSVVIGGGQAIAKHLSASGSISYVAVAAGGCNSVPTIAVAGAAVGDSVSIGIDGTLAGASLFMYMGYVSAPGVVTVRACNHDSISASVTGTVKIDVWQ